MTSVAPSLTVLSTNPLDHAGEIKELFLADQHPEFPAFFDRAYPSGVGAGGKSWIGVEADGRVVMHIARFPRRFAVAERTVVGGVLLDLMAAKSHRTVVPALALIRQLTADSKNTQDVDFLYAIPNAQATALFKVAGFSVVATVGRFVLPLADGSWYADAALRVYHGVMQIRAGRTRVEAVGHPAQAFDASAYERPVGVAPTLRPFRSPELYRQCLAGYPAAGDRWFTFHRGDRGTPAIAAALVRGGADHVATLLSVSRDPSLSMATIVPALAAALRRAGYRRLSVSTVIDTPFARDLTRAGFVARSDREAMLGCAVTEVGADVLRSVESWEITGLDCDPH